MRACVLRIHALLFVALAWAMPASAAEPHWPATLTIGTASPGGTYHAYGAGLARLLTRELRLPVAILPTEGPSQNITLLEDGAIQLAFVTMGAALEGWNGTGSWTNGRTFRTMRAMFPMYDTPFHIVVREDRDIQSIADLAGKRIGVGPHGGTAGTYVPKMLATLHIEATLTYGTWEEQAAQMQADSLDALAAAAGAPFPALLGLEATSKVRYLPLQPEQILALRLAIPELTASSIAPGTYPSLQRSYQTVGLYNFAVAHKDLPTDLVYAIVDTVFGHHEEMLEIHPAAAATVPANFTHNSFLPYHDGAIRYLQNRMPAGVVLAD